MSIATVDKDLIHYEALGRGEPLVYVHGWLGSWRYWWPSMQHLSSRHRTYAFDLWGFGDSSKAQDKYFFEAYVEMLDQFIETLGMAKPLILVGHALGAAVSLRYALLRPGHVRRLILVSLPLQGEHINQNLTTSDSTDFLNRVIGRDKGYSEVESETHKTDQVAMNSLASQLAGYNFADDVLACPCPTLLIAGERDSVIRQPADDYDKLEQQGTNRHYVSLNGSNHFPMLEQPATFNRLLLDFIQTDGNGEIAPKEHWQRRTR